MKMFETIDNLNSKLDQILANQDKILELMLEDNRIYLIKPECITGCSDKVEVLNLNNIEE